jgi:hypothetical protein
MVGDDGWFALRQSLGHPLRGSKWRLQQLIHAEPRGVLPTAGQKAATLLVPEGIAPVGKSRSIIGIDLDGPIDQVRWL